MRYKNELLCTIFSKIRYLIRQFLSTKGKIILCWIIGKMIMHKHINMNSFGATDGTAHIWCSQETKEIIKRNPCTVLIYTIKTFGQAILQDSNLFIVLLI